jgi:hypothetical protein
MQKAALKALSFVLLLAVPVAAYAHEADCSGAPKWDGDHTYKKGERVWYSNGSPANLYSCENAECRGSSARPDSSAWKLVGWCKKKPD